MYEEIAWNNFCKTGDLESFLQYKEYKRTLEKTKDTFYQNAGDNINELNKGKRNSN